MCLRQYNGRILFVPAPGFESHGQPGSFSLYKEPTVSNKAVGYQGPDTEFEDLEWREIKGPFVSVWLHNVPWGAEDTLAAPDAKVTFTLGSSVLFTCKHIVTLSFLYGFDEQFSDGFLDLIVLKNCPKLALLSLMTQISEGTHVQSPYVAYLKVCDLKP